MKRRSFLSMVGTGAALLPQAMSAKEKAEPEALPQNPVPIPAGPASPFNVGSRAQLFVDRVLVRETEGVAFTLHPAEKHPDNPLVKADRPWEGWRLEIFGNVLYDEDEKLFKMWYIGEALDYFPKYATMYATSHDGIHWEKPLIGTVLTAKGNMKTNAVAYGCHLASVMKDKKDPDPERRYKMTCWRLDESAYQTMVSPDGLHWRQYSRAPICPGGDVITGYYDEQRKLYVAFAKIMTEWRGHSRRVFYVITSPDFKHWTKPELAWTPDLRDDAGSLARIQEARPILDVPDNPQLMRTEFYGIGTYLHESCLLAFPWIFTINNNARYGNQEGPFELQLGVSRDLVHWERPFRVPCLPRGKLGEWDCGLFVTPSRALRVGDEVWLYYGGSNYTHGTPCLYRAEGTGRGTKFTGSIGLAKWKLDRFVSVDAPEDGGMLTTVPIVFSGNRLEINARTKPHGRVSVEILDAAGRPVEGMSSSDAFTGDDLRHVVTWKGERKVSQLQGQPVSLKIHLRDAEFYSFAFRE